MDDNIRQYLEIEQGIKKLNGVKKELKVKIHEEFQKRGITKYFIDGKEFVMSSGTTFKSTNLR